MGGAIGAPAAAATPPPTPPPIGTPANPQPQPNATVFPTPAVTAPAAPAPYKPAATPSPPPNARKGLDGVWEVAIQHSDTTDYTHFAVRQQGDTTQRHLPRLARQEVSAGGNGRRSIGSPDRDDAERNDDSDGRQARRHDRYGRHADDARLAAAVHGVVPREVEVDRQHQSLRRAVFRRKAATRRPSVRAYPLARRSST